MYNIDTLKSFLRQIIPQAAINLGFHLPKAFFASLFNQFPARKLKVIGVTGTDGKTTTVNLIYHILNSAGIKTGMVSTVGAKIGQEEIELGFHVTAPDPWPLQKLLQKMVDRRMEYVILETSSHGLDQYRFGFINFEIGAVTNITHDHLDYHKTYENYLAAKAALFNGVKIAVLNRDDKSYEFLKHRVQRAACRIITYGVKNQADYTPKNFKFKISLPGEYNQYNCLAAIAVASSLGISPEKIRLAISTFIAITGRMEEIKEGQDFRTVIDFAKTPSGLENILKTLRSQLKANSYKLIAVFGSAGLRDVAKRSMMGEVGGRLADICVLTAEDPRTEDVNKIIDQMAEGCEMAGKVEGKTYFKIPDRQEAINFAIQKLARKGDIVVTCGKGHEKSMCFGQKEYPWSEHEAVRKALKGRKETK